MLAIAVITVLAMGSLTATASAAPNCSVKFGPDSVTATCDWPAYRVVASCVNGNGSWTVTGNPATAGHGKSTATCKGGKVADYSVQSNARVLLPPGCTAIVPFQVFDGFGIRAFCDGTYRVVVHCETLFSKWYVQGNVASPGHRPSEAVCHGAVLTDYYVEIV